MEALRNKKVFLIDTLSTDSSYVLQFAQQNKIITDREYRNLNHRNHTGEEIVTNLLDTVRNKGKENSEKFVELLKNEELQNTFPKLKDLFSPATSAPSAPPEPQHDGPGQPSNEMGEYTMSKIPRGDCVIINNMDFTENNKKNVKKMKFRTGSNNDKDSLEKVFSWLGFTVFVRTDQTAEQMRAVLKEFSQKTVKSDCFVCCILSHGCAEGVYGVDGGVVSREDIFGPFRGSSCPSLASKPKAFFIQACRGRQVQPLVKVQADNVETDEDEDEDEEEFELDGGEMTIPDDADFFVARSTVKGFFSFRRPDSGSLFIQSLCKQLERFCPEGEGIQHILNCVHQEVSSLLAQVKINQKKVDAKQMPVQKCTLRKKLVFRVPPS